MDIPTLPISLVGQGGAASKVLLSFLDEAEYDEDQSERGSSCRHPLHQTDKSH